MAASVDQLPPIPSGRGRGSTDYMYRPPTIRPNYGKIKETYLPKTKMSRVLLFENNMQMNCLNVKLRHIAKERKSYKFAFRKNRYAFIDMQNHRKKYHEQWERGYNKLKDAFIAQYGRLYTPVPTPFQEVDPFLMNARLAPPINILCFYLDSKQREEKEQKHDLNKQRLSMRHRPTKAECLHDYDRLLRRERSDFCFKERSVEDPRFQNLFRSLVIPDNIQKMGYEQLSPTFHDPHGNIPKKPRLQPRHREITLPNFYTRRRNLSPEPETPKLRSRRQSVGIDSTFPFVDDKRSSFSELSAPEMTDKVEQTDRKSSHVADVEEKHSSVSKRTDHKNIQGYGRELSRCSGSRDSDNRSSKSSEESEDEYVIKRDSDTE